MFLIYLPHSFIIVKIFYRLPKFKSEVKRVLCIETALSGYSSYKHQSTIKSQQRFPSNDSPKSDNRDTLISKLKRNKSAPEHGPESKSQQETPRRAESTRYQSAVRFSSAGSYPPTPQISSPKR